MRAAISSSLPLLWLATTMRRVSSLRISDSPDPRFGKFQRIAGGIAEIDGAAAVRPFEVGLDGDIARGQMRFPALDLGRLRPKAEMAGATCAVGWHGQPRALRGRNGCRLRVEQQQYAVAAAEEDVTAGRLGDPFQAQHLAIEALRRIEVLGVQG